MSEETQSPKDVEEKSKPYQSPEGSTKELIVTVGDATLICTAVADWLVLRKREKPLADIFHVFYRLNGDVPSNRPVTFVFNGGPGASSAYLHMGALGPSRVGFGADGSLMPPPARLTDNESTWLTFTDLVFVDPVGTGFSRAVEKPGAEKSGGEKGQAPTDRENENKEFFELTRDLEALGEFISKFLSKHRLWSRPIFIAGESYGGFRVAKLARKLQEGYGVGLNGAILISPALELTLLEGSDYDVLMWADVFPSLALAAFHHGRSRAFRSGTPLEVVRHAAEEFAATDLVVLLAGGEVSGAAERSARYERIADLLGVSTEFVALRGGRISISAFTRELLREERKVCGLYDASATAIDPFPDREHFEGADPTLFAIERVFTGAINVQLRETLGIDTERDYRLLSMDVNTAWKFDSRKHAFDSQIGATDDLRYGMSLNPHMKVFICNGYYDLVTPYFASQRIANLMKLHPSQQDNLLVRGYYGGHMFYTWEESRHAFRRDIEQFYASALTP